jgi:hypothetical protein
MRSDVGNLYWERRQLNGRRPMPIGSAARWLGGSAPDARNNHDERSRLADCRASRPLARRPDDADDPGFIVEPARVTVTARTGDIAAQGNLPSILAGVLGVTEYATQATAIASWGTMGGGNTIPLTFSVCEWLYMTGFDPENDALDPEDFLPSDVRTVYFHSSQTAKEVETCQYNPANQDHPGGFGWLNPSTGPCEAYVEEGTVETDVGNNVPSGCTAAYLASLIGETVLMPIFESVDDQGSKAIFTISGFAAMELLGYRLSGNPAYNVNPPCSGNDRCISGRFVAYYDLDAVPDEFGGENYGAFLIGLTG